jgi:hypothetical protein
MPETVNREVTLHGGILHGLTLELSPVSWQQGVLVATEYRPPGEGGRRVIQYTRVAGRPRDFEFAGTL